LGDTLHDRLDGGSGAGKALKFQEKFFMRKHRVTALVPEVRGLAGAECFASPHNSLRGQRKFPE
jgi:hypothetical protein